MGKTIGMINQKGGVGKSMLAVYLANMVQKYFNPESSGNRVCIYDTDIPQYSTYNLREEEYELLEEYAENENFYYDRKLYDAQQQGWKLYDLFHGDLEKYAADAEDLKNNYDIVIIDVVGTMNTVGFNNDFLNSFDLIIIPTDIKYEPLRATLRFLNTTIIKLHQEGIVKDYAVLLNKIEHFERSAIESTIESFKTENINVISKYVKKQEKYTKQLLSDSKGMLSSVIPSMDIDLYNVTEEILNRIN